MSKPLHERIIEALQAQACAAELGYLIDELQHTQINNHALAAILLFTVIYTHPNLMNDPEAKTLRKLCQECYLHATPNQLHALLSKPENRKVKTEFDRFINHLLQENEAVVENRVSSRRRS